MPQNARVLVTRTTCAFDLRAPESIRFCNSPGLHQASESYDTKFNASDRQRNNKIQNVNAE